MAEYVLLTAGNALGVLQMHAGRMIASIGVLEVVLLVAGAWLLWRLIDIIFGTRPS